MERPQQASPVIESDEPAVVEKPQPAAAINEEESPESPADQSDVGGFLAKVVSVTDSDTIKILDAKNEQHTIRLNGIDTPERNQAYGKRAKQALSELIFGKEIRCVALETDQYGRTIADIYVGDTLVNLELVKRGWAWHYKRYSDDEELAAAEIAAQEAKCGLWADPQEPIPPWEFRRRERQK